MDLKNIKNAYEDQTQQLKLFHQSVDTSISQSHNLCVSNLSSVYEETGILSVISYYNNFSNF